ncbi:hypothetical protein NADFUDRAFT_50890 [Nadsonia fulvescens var. elongata DSM 6958]|uniref:BRCT domain-containing protein n=1 Tax=Nadsonia fulvescens var. elongata DSM 6958 TaxID=857566 RepID=A0A1E3PJL7_9ASCO|nr:hypothetical protein NADFUDRAFT_50890 [Nadsonia fulvescens var. elongata DSM 6958]
MDANRVKKAVFSSRVSKRALIPAKRVSKQSIRNQKVIIQMQSYVNKSYAEASKDYKTQNADAIEELGLVPAKPLLSEKDSEEPAVDKHLFSGCRVFINGTTSPHISDYLLRQKLIERGARLVTSLSSSSRGLTHMLLCGNLSASRRSKLLSHPGLKVVTIFWALDSIRYNERQLEGKYKCERHLHDETQGSIKGFLR